jgi:hypothetical protein
MRDDIRIEHDVPLPGAEPVAPEDVVVEVDTVQTVDVEKVSRFELHGATQAKEQYKREHLYKLSQQFLNDLRHAWDERGAQALEALAIHAPDKFVAVVAQLVSRPDAQADVIAADPANQHRGLQEISERTRFLLARVAAGDGEGPGET